MKKSKKLFCLKLPWNAGGQLNSALVHHLSPTARLIRKSKDIKPGYRWDGKVRGNGHEQEYFHTKNQRHGP